MRFWITKNSELSIREQLVRQVVLGILSEDLPAGHKLPSVRELARRHHIHSNTVSAAYHDLLQKAGWNSAPAAAYTSALRNLPAIVREDWKSCLPLFFNPPERAAMNQKRFCNAWNI
jgi:DNA-binding transcriptional MocR family regulator